MSRKEGKTPEDIMSADQQNSNTVESLYVHFPFCQHLCNYCDFFKNRPDEEKDYRSFEESLDKMYSSMMNVFRPWSVEWAPLKTVYIGGGTPSLWGADGAKFFQEFLNRHQLSLADDCEFSMEMNPNSWSDEGVNAWRKVGVNRFSVGVQSFNQEVLKVFDRDHNLENVEKTLKYLQKNGENYSVDFLIGAPVQDGVGRNIVEELDKALSYSPTHISAYILTAKHNYPHRDILPKDDQLQKEYELVASHLEKKGMRHYEVSNFAVPGKECLHNLKYWSLYNMAALGPSAVGLVWNRGPHGVRFKFNAKYEVEIERLSLDELRLEEFYLALRLDRGLNINDWGTENLESLKSLKAKWLERDLIHPDSVKNDQTLALNAKGLIIMDFLMGEVMESINFIGPIN